MANDDDLFAQAMSQVKPLSATVVENKIAHKTVKKQEKQPKELQIRTKTPISSMPSPKEGAEAWVLCADGVSKETLKKLANGQPNPAQTVDLHGMSRDEALGTLETALKACQQGGGRVLRAIHGRGLHSQAGKPVLKQSVYQWLRCGSMSGYVLAAVPEAKTAGGACLILLRRDKTK